MDPAVIDKTVHETNQWLHDIAEALGHPDRQVAYHALRGTLFALRDRLPVESTHKLAAQLLTLVRGVFFEGYRPSGEPEKFNRPDFPDRVSEELQQAEGASPEAAVRAVFGTLAKHIDQGEITSVRNALPAEYSDLWTRAPEA